MGFGTAVVTCITKYATFHGRASRSEFWWFYLFCGLWSFVVHLLTSAVDLWGFAVNPDLDLARGFVVFVVLMLCVALLAFTVARFAVGARRLHDTGRSGWWQLLELTIVGHIVLIIWWVFDSQNDANQYGEVPKDKLSGATN